MAKEPDELPTHAAPASPDRVSVELQASRVPYSHLDAETLAERVLENLGARYALGSAAARAAYGMHDTGVLDAAAVIVGSSALRVSEEAVDTRKARLAESFAQAPVRRPKPPEDAVEHETSRQRFDALLADSPFEWIKSDSGLLVAIAKQVVRLKPDLTLTSDFIIAVAKEPSLHQMVTARLEPFGSHRVEAFSDGVKHFLSGHTASAIACLNVHLEGVIYDTGLNQKLLQQRKKIVIVRTNRDANAVEWVLEELKQGGLLSDEVLEFLHRHTYSGTGHPFRHGFAQEWPEIHAAKLILAYYLITMIPPS